MTSTHRLRRSVFVVSSLLVLLVTEAPGQSGRRAPKTPQTPAINPQNETESRPKTDGRELKHKVSLLVAREPTSQRLLSEEAIFSHFGNRLNEFLNVAVTELDEIKCD